MVGIIPTVSLGVFKLVVKIAYPLSFVSLAGGSFHLTGIRPVATWPRFRRHHGARRNDRGDHFESALHSHDVCDRAQDCATETDRTRSKPSLAGVPKNPFSSVWQRE